MDISTIKQKSTKSITENSVQPTAHKSTQPISPDSGYSSECSSYEEGPASLELGRYLNVVNVYNIKKPHLKPRGLVNAGTYCYMIAVLQAMIAYAPLAQLFLEMGSRVDKSSLGTRGPVITALCHFVENFEVMKPLNKRRKGAVPLDLGTAFEPISLYNVFKGSFQIIPGVKQDAEQFLSVLLKALADEMAEFIKLVPQEDGLSPRRTPIEQIFGGILKRGSIWPKPFFTMPLNIENRTIEQALKDPFQEGRNLLEGQRTVFECLPRVMVFHVQCFELRNEGWMKLHKEVEIPRSFTIDGNLLSSGKEWKDSKRTFTLYAVTSHIGSGMECGHYVTDAYHWRCRTWLRFNDARVMVIDEDNVLSPEEGRMPYLLLYKQG